MISLENAKYVIQEALEKLHLVFTWEQSIGYLPDFLIWCGHKDVSIVWGWFTTYCCPNFLAVKLLNKRYFVKGLTIQEWKYFSHYHQCSIQVSLSVLWCLLKDLYLCKDQSHPQWQGYHHLLWSSHHSNPQAT